MKEGAMGNANVTLVQGFYAAFGRGDIATIINGIAPKATWEIVGRKADFPTLGTRHGPDGVKTFFDDVGQHLAFTDFSPKEFYAVDDKVFVLGHYAATVKKTGRSLACDWIHIFTFDGGKVTQFREFTDTAQAAEAYRG
jgi:ketosteroid isomerase-like protein